MVTEAADLLGGGWQVAGKGRDTALMRSEPQWWLQFVYQEATSSGRMVAYQGLLSFPLPATQVGMGGVVGERLKVPDRPDVLFHDVSDPAVVADFAAAAVELKLEPYLDVHHAAAVSEEYYIKNCADGRADRIYQGIALQHLVAQRVLCGSRPLPDLIGDVRRVLDDDRFRTYGIFSGGSASKSEAILRAYWEDLYARMQTGDRGAVQELLAQTRADTLRSFGLSDSQIPDPVFRTLEVPW
ncbi:hypothetical protein [Gordonia caeni]|uniref:Uncharacterized protein n=1 Tax=Gordonia caeni TaxID=1007097 RepID=A0ABP7NP58_9ACTN